MERRGTAALTRQEETSVGVLPKTSAGLRPNAREEFERKFVDKVMNGLYSTRKADEKSLDEWTEELKAKAQATDRRREAWEAKQMELEDSSSHRRRAWEKLWAPGAFSSSPYLRTGN